ncbi:hypothetical protein MKEN_00089200 [Mycena kentingensis (nom. inval.)]|nr:hypothetical protein MKEN_00089200 [Mycena kentingensis (nom. inval.)]
MSSSALTGYFRCSDVLFHYHQSIKDTRDGVQLQKALHPEWLVHPRHPLASPDGGIHAYIGTFYDGQARLLFSSAQVDYLRYWMQQMELTEGLIPLPYSDAMFLSEEIPTVVSVVFQSVDALTANSKKLGRLNAYLAANPKLVERRALFERVRQLVATKTGVWCALNIAAWERDHTVLSDAGWSSISWDDAGAEVAQNGHCVVAKNQTYRKTHFEEDSAHELMSMATVKQRIQQLFVDLHTHGPVLIISTDGKGLVKYLTTQLSVPMFSVHHTLPETLSGTTDVYIVDPCELYNALVGRSDAECASRPLERVCKHLGIAYKPVRNAAVDAQTALDLVRSMASGETLDAQRERRWPTQMEPQVKFAPWEEDPMYEDQETVFPPFK